MASHAGHNSYTGSRITAIAAKNPGRALPSSRSETNGNSAAFSPFAIKARINNTTIKPPPNSRMIPAITSGHSGAICAEGPVRPVRKKGSANVPCFARLSARA